MYENMLNKLGIVGWGDTLEDLVLAAVLTGDSLLLVGRHGSAKSFCVNQVARALGVKFGKIDASKAEFEDILGFPNPKSLSEGKFEYISTPISVADKEFLFIDEINRAKPHIQSKLLELCYSRELMGMPTKIRWVWGAMNLGEEYTGLEPLDPAFAGRFAFILPIPQAIDMQKEESEQIIESESDSDAIALKMFWSTNSKNTTRKNHGCPNSQLTELLKTAGRRYESLPEQTTNLIRSYLSCFAQVLNKEAKIKIDGRRLSMMRRNVLGYLSIREAKSGKQCDAEDIPKVMHKVLPHSLPYPALGKPLETLKLEAAFRLTQAFLGQQNAFYQAIFEDDPVKQAEFLLKSKLSSFAQRKILRDILDENKGQENVLMSVVLSPFALLPNSPLLVDVRLIILKKLKWLINKLNLLGEHPIEITGIKDLRTLKKIKGNESRTKLLLSRIVSGIVREDCLRPVEQGVLMKKARDFLLYARRILQPVYQELKNV